MKRALTKKEKEQWKHWINIVKESFANDTMKEIIEDTPKKYKKLVAAALAVAKWHPLRSLLEVGIGDCGLCIFYGKAYNLNDTQCKKCELKKIDKSCVHDNSLYDKAVVALDRFDYEGGSKRAAIINSNRMFKVLYQIYRKEYKKVIK